jgi:hypothetical protein
MSIRLLAKGQQGGTASPPIKSNQRVGIAQMHPTQSIDTTRYSILFLLVFVWACCIVQQSRYRSRRQQQGPMNDCLGVVCSTGRPTSPVRPIGTAEGVVCHWVRIPKKGFQFSFEFHALPWAPASAENKTAGRGVLLESRGNKIPPPVENNPN